MKKAKTLEQLRAEKERAETQLAQEQHKLERLENRKKYLEKGERTKRTHLLYQTCVGLGDSTFEVVGVNALSLAGGLSGSDRAGDFRVEYPDAAAQCGAQGGDNAFGIVGSPVHHGHKDSVDFQLRIDLPTHSADGADEQIQTLCGKKVRCRRDDHAVGGNQSIDGHQPQGRHTVNENVVVVLFHPAENGFQHLLPGHGIEQAHFYAGQFNVRRKQIDPLAAVDDAFFPGNGFIPDFGLHGSSQCGVQILVSVPYA